MLVNKRISGISVAVSLLALAACGQETGGRDGDAPVDKQQPSSAQVAQEPGAAERGAVERNGEFPTTVYWGDTHLHTTDSPDAYAFGTRLDSEDALRFARGEQVTSTSGIEARLARPLDFLVIADHAVGLGISREVHEGNPALIADPVIARWHEMLQAGGEQAQLVARELIDGHLAGTNPEIMSDPTVMGPIVMNIWRTRGGIVDRYNEPGKFSAFIGYEYTSTPLGDNLHRVVVFRDGADKTNTVLPFSSSMSDNPEDLWTALGQYEKLTGGKVLAIPHNSNVSNGRMFAFTDFEGEPIDAEYASTQARWEPLVEVTQIKGDSESHPFLSPNDEFAGYGDDGWDRGNLNLSALKEDDMLAGEYVREALKRGLSIEAETGANPFKMGMIGSTDSHTGLATAYSDNYFGKHTGVEPGPDRAAYEDAIAGRGLRIGWHYLASGYAAVWARENTREALFDAMMRKEVYATTGPRITLRFFGGWDFRDEDARAADLAARGYEKGVPMGADLAPQDADTAPTFLLSALMDPEGANLDRIQVVKGWLDNDGTTHERVFDVAWSGDRAPDDGKLPPVGNTVDLSGPTWSNSIGAAELKATWQDPEFDPQRPAFYYVRVIEIPTPRWPAYDAARYGADIPDDALLTTQERAYSSPIWYSPN